MGTPPHHRITDSPQRCRCLRLTSRASTLTSLGKSAQKGIQPGLYTFLCSLRGPPTCTEKPGRFARLLCFAYFPLERRFAFPLVRCCPSEANSLNALRAPLPHAFTERVRWTRVPSGSPRVSTLNLRLDRLRPLPPEETPHIPSLLGRPGPVQPTVGSPDLLAATHFAERSIRGERTFLPSFVTSDPLGPSTALDSGPHAFVSSNSSAAPDS